MVELSGARKYGEKLYDCNFKNTDNMCVYSIQNKVSGKAYIGITSYFLINRINDHFKELRRGKHRNNYLQKAFIKYGESAFSVKCLYNECKDLETLAVLEAIYHELYQCDAKKFGYNLDIPGKIKRHSEETKAKIGLGNKGKIVSQESRLKMSLAQTSGVSTRKDKKTGIQSFLDKKHTLETKQKISEKAKQRWLLNPNRIGLDKMLAMTKEQRMEIAKKQSDRLKVIPNPASRAVFCYNRETGQQMYFWCVRAASKHIGLQCSTIQRSLRREKRVFDRHPFSFSYYDKISA